MENDTDAALAVEAKEHEPLSAEPVRETPEDDAPKHHAAKVGGRHHRCKKRSVADQAPLGVE